MLQHSFRFLLKKINSMDQNKNQGGARMESLFGFGVLILAVLYFVIINKMFNIYYFGCAGIGSVFGIAFVLAIATLELLGVFLPYIIGILVIGAIIAGSNKDNTSAQNENTENKE